MAPSVRKSSVDACPDLETLAGYLDGRLTERERADIAAHVAGCETCYFVFTEAAQTRASDRARAETDASASPEPVSAATPKWWMTPKAMWSSAAGLAAAAALVVAIGTAFLPSARGDSAELRALVAAGGTDRTIEGRLTGGFAYGPLRSATRGADPMTPSLSPDVRIAAAQLEKAAADDRTAEGLRERGIAALMSGEWDRGVAALEEAASGRSTDARVQTDLSAAYLARATRTSRDEDLSKALAAANRAVNANRMLPEALFNRAFALERLSMPIEARDAWRAYLTIDDRSGWADEARSHLRTLTDLR